MIRSSLYFCLFLSNSDYWNTTIRSICFFFACCSNSTPFPINRTALTIDVVTSSNLNRISKCYCRVWMQQGNSLRTTLKSTCISRLRSALSTSPCWWSSPRGHIRWAIFIGWSQTTARWCVVRLHRTRHWRPSYQESTVCHRAITVVHLLPVRPSTTGRTHNSVNSSTTVRVLTAYNRDVKTTRWQQKFWNRLPQTEHWNLDTRYF